MGTRRPEFGQFSASDIYATSVFVMAGIWGGVLCLQVAHGLFGIAGVIIGAVLFPVLLLTAPWYALFALGDPLPAILCYGGAFLAWALVALLGDELRRWV